MPLPLSLSRYLVRIIGPATPLGPGPILKLPVTSEPATEGMAVAYRTRAILAVVQEAAAEEEALDITSYPTAPREEVLPEACLEVVPQEEAIPEAHQVVVPREVVLPVVTQEAAPREEARPVAAPQEEARQVVETGPRTTTRLDYRAILTLKKSGNLTIS
ncbi:hypothetical protein LshimejAT787_2900180 [Lyophyllum shimeji]|uniref:Uncharacterized protein n=1 Tax=Lyophyllum shimeji TaxID=47721 RepID=A0A9P3UVD8_LYOSH|nr:hypothetical protein LshimejAT787_2900180 [Lyophyllum shimeji]